MVYVRIFNSFHAPVLTISKKRNAKSSIQKTHSFIYTNDEQTKIQCTWPEELKVDEAPSCAPISMLCEFCMTTVYNLYFFDAAGCGAFPYEQQAACTKISDALFKKSTEIVTQMNQYVSTMGVAGGATKLLCQDYECCKVPSYQV